MNADGDASRKHPVVLATAAHPDDIEFLYAGTLLHLADRGCEVHMWNLCNGSCGSLEHGVEEIVALRHTESAASAALAGATLHPPLFDDLDIFYDRPSLAAVAAVVRRVNPTIVLTHAPADYMEDHENVCRLVTSACFSKSMPNYRSQPPVPHAPGPVAVYHAPPHGLRNGLNQPAQATHFVAVDSVMDRKRALLQCHRSQDAWLNTSQGMSAYVQEMEQMMTRLGKASGRFAQAEGWRHHNYLGFGPADFDPLADLLTRDGLIHIPENPVSIV